MRYARLLLLACLSLGATLPASAQGVYQCKVGNSTVFSDRPCPGASSTEVNVRSAPPAKPAGSYTPPVAPGGVLPSAGELQQRCAAGDAGACDFLACANRNDRAACARAQGAPQGRTPGAGWTAVSTKETQRPQKDQATGVRMVREQETVIQCDSGRRGMVVGRRDISRYSLPDGSAHGSLAAAAAALCGR